MNWNTNANNSFQAQNNTKKNTKFDNKNDSESSFISSLEDSDS